MYSLTLCWRIPCPTQLVDMHAPHLLLVQLKCFSSTGERKLRRSVVETMTLESRLFRSSHHFLPHMQLFCFCMCVSMQGRILPAFSSWTILGFTHSTNYLECWVDCFTLDRFQMTLNWSFEKSIIQKTNLPQAIAGNCQLCYYFSIWLHCRANWWIQITIFMFGNKAPLYSAPFRYLWQHYT